VALEVDAKQILVNNSWHRLIVGRTLETMAAGSPASTIFCPCTLLEGTKRFYSDLDT